MSERIELRENELLGNIDRGIEECREGVMMPGADKTRRETIEEAFDYHAALVDESDRGAAVLAAARFEEFLRLAIGTRLIELNETEQKEIFGPSGVLSGFNRRINIVYALGFYDRNTLGGLKTVGRIRNKFAHSTEPMGFDHVGIVTQCEELKTCRKVDNARERYLTFLRETEDKVWRKMLCG